jgi:chromosome segregation protein
MYLKSLEIQGFKSFPDKTVLKFDQGMTAVVGPNGAGKSNISDAVKWVLGEQSTKSLRSSKMEDVIFNGTSARKALGFAEVTLNLDNRDRFLNRDEDNVSVTRRYFRSGDSEYLINGLVVRLRDVNELFMDTGLGRDGYSMIGQGCIENLVSTKSSDRRDIFEEAAGISHFRYRRNDAIRRLDAAEENLVRLRDILGELESRVEPLRIQSEKAKKFILLADERKNLEIGLWLDTLEKSSSRIREQANKIEIVQLQHIEVANALDIIFSEIEQAQQDSRNITLKIEEFNRENSAIEEQASSLDSVVAVDRNSIEHNLSAIERAKADISDEESTDKHFVKRLETAKKEIEELNILISNLRAELDKKSENLGHFANADDEISQNIVSIENEISSKNEELSRNSMIKSSAESAIEEIKSRVISIDENAETRAKEIKELSEKKTQIATQISEISEEITSGENSLAGFKLRVENRQNKTDEQKRLCETSAIEIERTYSRIKMLEEMEKNMEGYSGAVKAIMREQKSGGLSGIHGTLAMLISTDNEYNVAIETALGTAIQNIVTDNENDAKRAMYFLRDRNAGRATFLPVSAIVGRDLDEDDLEDNEGFIDIASNLVDCDEKYDEIIISLLGRTVVVQDIDYAISMAKKYKHRFKIVTLDGQLVNAGGSMTGGSQQKSSGFLSRANEIESLKENVKKAEDELAENQETLKSLTEELGKAKADYDGNEAEIFRLRELKIKSESNLTVVDGQLNSLLEAEKALNDEKQSSEIRIKRLRENADYANGEIEKIRKDIADLDSKKATAVSERNAKLGDREQVNSEISDLNLKIVAALKDIENHKNDISALENRRATHENRTQALYSEIESLEKQNAELESKIAQTIEMASNIRAKAKANNDMIVGMVEERGNHDKKASDLRVNEKENQEKKERLASELVRLEERKAALTRDSEEIERRLFDDYQLTKREANELDIVIENISESEKRLRELTAKIRALGNVNVAAVDEYKEVSERYEFMKTQIEDVEKSKRELSKMIDELTDKMSIQFKEKFVIIDEYFRATFRELFGGGAAELILEDPEDVLECGIEIKAQPPGKNVKSISLLSGGEKGLTAISLLFAILKLNPAPFCIFDEVEAALDDINVTKYAKYVRAFAENTQFILITHRRGTMEEADTLYGVTMQEEGVSKLLKLETSEIAKEWGLE